MIQKSIQAAGLFLCIHIQAAHAQTVPLINDSIRKTVIRQTGETLIHNYVYPEKADSMAGYLQQQAEKYPITDPYEFAETLTGQLHHIYTDKHLRIVYEPELEADIIKFNRTKKIKPKPSAEDVAGDAAQNFFFKKVEILPGNIGYIDFTRFPAPSPEADATIRAALQFVVHTDALILDLRNNTGGNGETAMHIARSFFNQKTYLGRSFSRIENRWTDVYAEQVKNGIVLDMPLYVLVGERTYSAAEGLAYTLQTLRHAVVVGKPTRGGAHLTRSFALGNGFVGFIPYSRMENAMTKTDWEGKGVQPQIFCNTDRCLISAQLSALQQKREKARDETEKRKLQWWINYYDRNPDFVPDSTAIKNGAGRFAEFEFQVSGTQILLRNINLPEVFSVLIPLSPGLFWTNDTQIEFLTDNTGQCHAIKMYWDDGWAEEIARTQ